MPRSTVCAVRGCGTVKSAEPTTTGRGTPAKSSRRAGSRAVRALSPAVRGHRPALSFLVARREPPTRACSTSFEARVRERRTGTKRSDDRLHPGHVLAPRTRGHQRCRGVVCVAFARRPIEALPARRRAAWMMALRLPRALGMLAKLSSRSVLPEFERAHDERPARSWGFRRARVGDGGIGKPARRGAPAHPPGRPDVARRAARAPSGPGIPAFRIEPPAGRGSDRVASDGLFVAAVPEAARHGCGARLLTSGQRRRPTTQAAPSHGGRDPLGSRVEPRDAAAWNRRPRKRRRAAVFPAQPRGLAKPRFVARLREGRLARRSGAALCGGRSSAGAAPESRITAGSERGRRLRGVDRGGLLGLRLASSAEALHRPMYAWSRALSTTAPPTTRPG